MSASTSLLLPLSVPDFLWLPLPRGVRRSFDERHEQHWNVPVIAVQVKLLSTDLLLGVRGSIYPRRDFRFLDWVSGSDHWFVHGSWRR